MAVTVDWVVLTAAIADRRAPEDPGLTSAAATGSMLGTGTAGAAGDAALGGLLSHIIGETIPLTSLTLSFSLGWLPHAHRPTFAWHADFGVGDGIGADPAGSSVVGGVGPSLIPSTIVPLGPTLIPYSFSFAGPTVTGTAAAERIVVGGGAEHVNGGGGNDTIVFDPVLAAGADRMVFLDGGPGADTYRLVAEPGTEASLPGYLIFDFAGPSLATAASPDKAVLVGLDPAALVVTDLGGGFFKFSDGSDVIEAGFHRQGWTPMTLDEIDDLVFLGKQDLSSIAYAISNDDDWGDPGDDVMPDLDGLAAAGVNGLGDLGLIVL